VKSNSKEDVSDQYAGLGSGEYGHPIRRISGESRAGPQKRSNPSDQASRNAVSFESGGSRQTV